MARLEALDALGHGGIVDIAAFLIGGQIFSDGEAAAQQRDVGAARAGRELDVGRQHRPAAAHLDRRIAQQGFLDALKSALVEGRIGG